MAQFQRKGEPDMRKRWLIISVAFAVMLTALIGYWIRSTTLSIERTVVAGLPEGISQLIKTDLDNDGEMELLATCLPTTSRAVWQIDEQSDVADPRIWLIRSPLTNPQLTQLPYVCRLRFPVDLTPLQEVPVENGEWKDFGKFREWLPRQLGWLRIRDGQIHFKPLCAPEQFTRHRLIDNILVAFVYPRRLLHSDVIPRVPNFAFRLNPNGTWQSVDLKKAHALVSSTAQVLTGDFDGDGLIDIIVPRLYKIKGKWRGKLEILWGSETPVTSLPPIEHLLIASEYEVADVDNDGRWEILTLCQDDLIPKRWKLTIWQFHSNQRRFVAVTQVRGTLPLALFKPTRRTVAPTTWLSSPLTVLMPDFFTFDLNADGKKDFVLVWRKGETFPGISAILQTEYIAVQVIWWCGKSFQVRTFSPHELPFLTKTKISRILSLQMLGEEQVVVVNERNQKRYFAFRFLSLRPLRVQLWDWRIEQQCVVMRLPNGDAALDLRRWEKLAELPGNAWLMGDWDKDGQQELLLQQWVIRKQPSFPFIASSSTSPIHVLYLARIDGRRVRWAKIVPPSPAVSTCALPLQTHSGAALFVLWWTNDKMLLERIRWRPTQ